MNNDTTLTVIQETEILGKKVNLYNSIEEPLFEASEVAGWLGVKNISQMLKQANIDESEKAIFLKYTLGGNQKSLFITEDAMYEVLMRSRKEGAKPFRKEIKKYQDYTRQFNDFNIPIEWLTEKRIYQLIVVFNMQENYKGKKYQKIAKYFETYHHFQKPIIIDKNGFVLDGFLAVMYARNVGLEKLPVIQLENVEVIF